MKINIFTGATKPSRILGSLWAITLLAGLLGKPANAICAAVRIEISATVSLVDDQDNLLHDAVAVDDTITGIYTYERRRSQQ
ncbi:MAG: hypothetical protein H0X40_02180 [Chthoniobacterales bacterium]|nr:hypothetical protein [Chthoniobacterales bacterium]